MSKHVDHAGLASAFIESNDVPAMQVGAARIAIAQVHATLALVEQQRIANLIAMATQPGAGRREASKALVAADGEGELVPRPGIRKVLGL